MVKWIEINGRPPSPGKKYLVCNKYDNPKIAYCNHTGWLLDEDKKLDLSVAFPVYRYDKEHHFNTFKYWAELPE